VVSRIGLQLVVTYLANKRPWRGAPSKIPYSTITGVDSTAAAAVDEAGQPIVLAHDEIGSTAKADDPEVKVSTGHGHVLRARKHARPAPRAPAVAHVAGDR
jgi:hypothetical protein